MRKLAQEAPGQTLRATAPVHEAYARLVDTEPIRGRDGRGRSIAAVAEGAPDRRRMASRISRATAFRHRHCARVWLDCAVRGAE